jgi:hypothetical protein
MLRIPLIACFWFMLFVYVVHILDESLLGGSFVEKVREHWWPNYSWRKFFWFNAGYLFLMSSSIVLYDRFGSRFLFLPLAWALERFINSLWHIWWTVHFRILSGPPDKPADLDAVVLYFVLWRRNSAVDLATRLAWSVAGNAGGSVSQFLYPHPGEA